MRPPRPPRDRLARALRRAAATADRLARALAPPPPGAAPERAEPPRPRRPGEPPEHWLRLVAAHAPGLLRDLPPGPAEPDVSVGSGLLDDAILLIDEGGAAGNGAGAGPAGAGDGAAGPGRDDPGRDHGRSGRLRPRDHGAGVDPGGEPVVVTRELPLRPSAPGSPRRPAQTGTAATHRHPDGTAATHRHRDGATATHRRPDGTATAHGHPDGAAATRGHPDGAARGGGPASAPDGAASASVSARTFRRRLRPGSGTGPDTAAGQPRPGAAATTTSPPGAPTIDAAARRGAPPGADPDGPGYASTAGTGPEVRRPRRALGDSAQVQRGPRVEATGPAPAGPRLRPGDPAVWTDPPEIGRPHGLGPGSPGSGLAPAGSADPRVRLSPRQGPRPHPNPPAASAGTGGTGPAGRGAPGRPEWRGPDAGPWPALPDEVHDVPRGEGRRDPWPALPDDRELWAPVTGVPDAGHLRRLDREQAGA
ncbi:hypothetical protein [Micromonospora narathiwatensis]|uniref:Uncharacterized protein n=1 Tax=Micromonospora narathiwatensis TaxID=299146 RepID=A0A1A8ZE10_9ACTN|nr:hypothetical protein [Micromonospora narathiwatensis]SBT42063.1 hypothetical protein GA0070621_1404 [Micromonospora narathiwatensis]